MLQISQTGNFKHFLSSFLGEPETLHLALILISTHVPCGSELTIGSKEFSGCMAVVEQGLGHFRSGWSSLCFSLQGWGKRKERLLSAKKGPPLGSELRERH